MSAAKRLGILKRGALATLAFAVASFALPTLISAQTAEQHPTFTRDVLPILQENCQNCHRPKGMAPMPLVTYAQVKPFAPLIKMKTSNRSMPPWHIDRNIGIHHSNHVIPKFFRPPTNNSDLINHHHVRPAK